MTKPYIIGIMYILNADMAELADAPDLGSGVFRRAGSSPVIRTKIQKFPYF